MSDDGAIEWVNANPVTGCTKLRAGCDLSYAEGFVRRVRGVPAHASAAREVQTEAGRVVR